MRDKDAAAAARVLRGADAVWTVGLPGERAHSAESLAGAFQEAGLAAEPVGTVEAGWARFQAGMGDKNGLLIAGSHVAVAESLRVPSLVGGGTD